MSAPGVYARQRDRYNAAIQLLEDGTSPQSVNGVSYTAAQLPLLYLLYDIAKCQASIESAQGAQAFQEGPRATTRAELRDLHAQLKDLQAKLGRYTRGGAIPVVEGVPR